MYVNIDINSRCTPFFDTLLNKETVTRQDVTSFLDRYSKTNITDLFFCIFCQYSATKSNIFSDYAKKYEQKTENDFSVDYTEQHGSLYTLNKKYGLDPYKIWFEECMQRGINPWLSIRMNDCHHPNNDFSFLRNDLFYEAKENGWMLGDQYPGGAKICLNYEIPKVRLMMLDYIEEQLNQYDVYGLELDFMREIHCFDYLNAKNEQYIELMNDFIRQVKKLTQKAEQKWGHSIKIAVRLTRDIDQSRKFGFDARVWSKENLVDIIIPSPRWESADSRIPVETWQKELPNITILPCIETVVTGKYGGYQLTSTELARGIIGGYLGVGAKDIYLYNYFGEASDGDSYYAIRDREIYKTAYCLEELRKHSVRYSVIGQEIYICPEGMVADQPLPITLDGEKKELSINTAGIPQNRETFLLLGFTVGSPDNIKIKLNGIICKGFIPADIPNPKKVVPDGCSFYQCSVNPKDTVKQILHFEGNNAEIVWVELIVI